MAEDILYLKLDTKIKISGANVRIGDLGKVYCVNQETEAKVKTLKVYKLQPSDQRRCVIGVLKVIAVILEEYPSLTIENLGETETIVEQEKEKASAAHGGTSSGQGKVSSGQGGTSSGQGRVSAGQGKPWSWMSILKIIFVSAICFFGTMYTIMAYHNDVAINDLFGRIYFYIMGEKSDGYTILELSYSIGLSLGIVIFYNHIGKRRLTPDPSPVEVEMRLYDDDVNHALIEMANREEKTIDVS